MGSDTARSSSLHTCQLLQLSLRFSLAVGLVTCLILSANGTVNVACSSFHYGYVIVVGVIAEQQRQFASVHAAVHLYKHLNQVITASLQQIDRRFGCSVSKTL